MENQAGKDVSPKQAEADKPWAPLTIPLYRSFWIAGLFSNMGTWMHETGAQWLMTSLEPSPEMVAAVRTCMTIPVFCLALPSGVWADQFNRRSWLLGTQMILLALALVMSLMTGLGLMTPVALLILTAAMGVAMILNQPAWQALTPELVPPALIPTAVSVGSISFNLARSLGPALGGLLIAYVGIWATFGFNAISFLGVVFVLLTWTPEASIAKPKKKPKFATELKKGLFLIKNTPHLKNALWRVLLFSFSASILWSLISLVAVNKLGFEERGFGVCLALIGSGAVIGAWFLPYIRTRLSSAGILLIAQCVYAAICISIALSSERALILPLFMLLGACWMASMTTLNATTQVNLPAKFRARGMAGFMMSFALGMAAGSFTWGWLARGFSLDTAFICAAITMALSALVAHRLDIGSLDIESLGKIS